MSRSALTAGVRHLRTVVASQGHRQDSDERLLHAFVTSRDETAFAALVRRYGPMVGAVCQRVLVLQQDAEDAFQATFVVLAQDAARLRKKTALASFLHGTAYRISLKAKRTAARRRKYEGQVQTRPSINPIDELSWREVRTLVDEEVARLPEKYRSALILCCLEGVSQQEAAQRLGVKEGTVSSRLARARERLAKQLSRRGVDLVVVLTAMGLASQRASALPAGLMATTIVTALRAASREELAGIVSASVVELVHGASAAMMGSKAKIATALLLIASVQAGAGAWTCRILTTPQLAEIQAELVESQLAAMKERQVPRENKGKDVTVSGRVVDPGGKPVRGAKIVFTYNAGEKIPLKIWAVSAADGRFAFTMPVEAMDKGHSEMPRMDTYIVAAAEGYGFAVAHLDKPGAADLTLRLVKDDVPIRGRIIDLQGKPVAGAHLRIENNMLGMSKSGDLTDWLAALKAGKENHEPVKGGLYWTWLYSPAFDLLFPPVTTGADGRFEMKGIGRERMAHLRIEGPTIATQAIEAMTRASETIQLPEQKEFPKGLMHTYYGADVELVAAPSKPIVGMVRDKDTGKPLAGVTVELARIADVFKQGFIRTTTDKDGRYRLEGLPKVDRILIAARADAWVVLSGKASVDRSPYVPAVQEVRNPSGLGPVTIDFALKRGVWVKGRVTEKNTGKPLKANVEYLCFIDNPNGKAITDAEMGYYEGFSREDGFFQVPVLPGHGLIAVRAHQDHYIKSVGADKIKGPRDGGQSDVFITAPHYCFSTNFHALIEINPKAGEESITCNVILDPGRSLKGTVLDSDGKPLAGTRITGLKDMGYWEKNAGPDFTVESLKPNKPRMLQFVHEGKKLSGYLIVRGDEDDPLRVQLKPWGTLTGRVLTHLGEPLTSVRVNCHAEVKEQGRTLPSFGLESWPGKDGRFRIEGLIAGMKYEVSVSRVFLQEISGGNPKDVTIKAGETKDLGDLIVKPIE